MPEGHFLHRVGPALGLHVHLGMQGKWVRLAPAPVPRPQVRLRLASAEAAWDLFAPSTCELLDDGGWKALVSGLGPASDAEPDRAYVALRRYPASLGAAVLDQTVVAGIGNVGRTAYACPSCQSLS